MRTTGRTLAALLGAAIFSGCSDYDQGATAPRLAASSGGSELLDLKTLKDKGDVKLVAASGSIADAVAQYRALLGNPNNGGALGEQPAGRREVNWDGVPAALTNTDAFPGNFFNVNAPRGVLFTTPGTGFRVSNNGYTDVNAAYAGEFNAFSPQRLFVQIGSNVMDVHFVVTGSNTPAVTTGFGVVFADVGQAHSTTLEYYDAEGNRIFTAVAPRESDATGHSFVGAVFDSPVVARVRITSGDASIGATTLDNVHGAGKKLDLVVTDDFIFGEPRAIR